MSIHNVRDEYESQQIVFSICRIISFILFQLFCGTKSCWNENWFSHSSDQRVSSYWRAIGRLTTHKEMWFERITPHVFSKLRNSVYIQNAEKCTWILVRLIFVRGLNIYGAGKCAVVSTLCFIRFRGIADN